MYILLDYAAEKVIKFILVLLNMLLKIFLWKRKMEKDYIQRNRRLRWIWSLSIIFIYLSLSLSLSPYFSSVYFSSLSIYIYVYIFFPLSLSFSLSISISLSRHLSIPIFISSGNQRNSIFLSGSISLYGSRWFERCC